MSTIKVDTVRPVTADASLTLQGDNSGTGVSGITIDSSGNATFAGTSNNLGTVTAGTIGGNVAMASSGLTVRNITQVALTSTQALGNSTTLTTFFSPTYTPLFSGSQVLGILNLVYQVNYSTGADARKDFQIEYTGTGITDTVQMSGLVDNLGIYSYDNNGTEMNGFTSVFSQLLVTSTTDIITANCKMANAQANAASSWTIRGSSANFQTFFTWMEFK